MAVYFITQYFGSILVSPQGNPKYKGRVKICLISYLLTNYFNSKCCIYISEQKENLQGAWHTINLYICS